MPVLAQLKRLFRSLANFSALVVGAAAGIAQLLGLSKGWGQVVLTGVGVVCLLFLVIRWWVLFYEAKLKELEAGLAECRAELEAARQEIELQRSQLATLQVGHQSYDEAIDHVVEQSESSYRERLEITVTIGADDDGDMIVERRHTMPTSRVTHRNFRPISTSDVALHTKVVEGRCQIAALPLVNQMPLRVWLVFRPSLSTMTEWEVEYRPRGLWAPLREGGTDKLVWSDRPPISNGVLSVLDELVVKFVFPRSDAEPSVTERFGAGRMSGATRITGSTGWLVEFRDERPAGRRYVWDLAQRPPVPIPTPAQPTPA
jgi:hypothetical protein